MEFVFITFLACSLFWGVLAVGQFIGTKNRQIVVPSLVAKICGSKTDQVDEGLFGLQVLSLLVFLWSILLSIAFPQGVFRGTLFWKGVFVMLSIIFIMVLFRDFRRRKDHSQ